MKDKFQEVLSNVKALNRTPNPAYTVHTISLSDGGLVWLSDAGLRSNNYSNQIQCLTNEAYKKVLLW